MADPPPVLRPVTELNRLSRAEFSAALEPLFEAAEPLAEALYAGRPFASYDALIRRAQDIATHLPEAQQIAVINAHPRIGADAASVSALSFREQGYAAEFGHPADELAQVYSELADLNRLYEERFGFRFVAFVNKRPKAVVLNVLRERIQQPREQELAASLSAIFLIARDRLASLSSSIGHMPHQSEDAHLAVLEALRRSALETYGEERSAEATLQGALNAAATAVWRVNQEPLKPLGNEPWPTHG